MKRPIYLDNNATTAIDARVFDIVVAELSQGLGNPSSIHSFGRRAKAKLLAARQTIAESLKVKPEEIIFTSGGTEGANLLIRGLFFPHFKGHIISSAVEHAAVFETLKSLSDQGTNVTLLSNDAFGAVQPAAVQVALRADTKAVILMAVNNETGVKTDVTAIASIAKEAHIPFIVDGVALLGKEQFTIPEGVSAMFFSGHKIHAPKGVGFMYIRSGFKFASISTGGNQEFRRRAGTENLPAILGLAEACRLLTEELPAAATRMQYLRDRLEKGLMAQLTNCQINGLGPRICNTSNIAFLGVEGELLLAKLDLAGIAVSHGSACASGGLQPSRVLLNMGTPVDTAASSIRFSLSRQTTEEEIDRAVATIVACVLKLR